MSEETEAAAPGTEGLVDPFAAPLVEPGVIETDFQGRSLDWAQKDGLDAYDATANKFSKAVESMNQAGSSPDLVAAVIFTAATEENARLRYPAGTDAEAMIAKRNEVGDEAFVAGIRQQMLG